MDVISDLPAGIEWRIYKGDTTQLTMYVVDKDDKPVDMTAYTVIGQIRERQDDANPLESLAISVQDNAVTFAITDTTVLPKIAYFDIQTTKDNVVKTLLFGKIIATLDVTRNG